MSSCDIKLGANGFYKLDMDACFYFLILCYILYGSFSTSTNDRMINVFTLVRASQNESPNSRYPKIPIAHEQSFIRIAPSPLDSLESPLLLETRLFLRDS